MDTRINRRLSNRLATTNQAKRGQKRAITISKKFHAGYDEFKIPCDWISAAKHGQASSIGKDATLIQDDNSCPCCGNQIRKESLSICCDLIEFGQLTAPIPNFFTLIKFLTIYLFILLIGSALDFLHIWNGDFCAEYPCYIWLRFSSINKLGLPIAQQESFWMISPAIVLLFFVWNHLLLRTQRNMEQAIDECIMKPEDFGVWAQNIKTGIRGKEYESELMFYFQRASSPGRQLFIKRISMVCHMDKYFKAVEDLEQLIKEKQQFMRKNVGQSTREYDGKIQNMKERLSKVEDDLLDVKRDFSGQCFIEYAKEGDKWETLENHELSTLDKFNLSVIKGGETIRKDEFKTFFWGGQHLLVEQAPNPRDIIWKNLNQNGQWKFLYRVGFFASQLILNLAINTTQKYILGLEDPKQRFMIILGAVMCYDIMILPLVMRKIIQMSKFQLQSDEKYYYTLFMSMNQFANIAIWPLYNTMNTNKTFTGNYGLISIVSILMILNIVMELFLKLIDLRFVWKKIQRLIHFNNNAAMLTQKEGNEIMQDPEYELVSSQIFILKTVWITAFYASFIPLGTFINLIGLVLFYWIEKMNLILRRSLHEYIHQEYTFNINTLIEPSILFYALGYVVLSHEIYHQIGLFGYITLSLALGYQFIPTLDLNYKIFPPQSKKETLTYEQCDKDFDYDYDRENPVTQRRALDKWIKLRSFAQQVVLKGVNKLGGTPDKSNSKGLGASPNMKGSISKTISLLSQDSDEEGDSQKDLKQKDSNLNIILEVPER